MDILHLNNMNQNFISSQEVASWGINILRKMGVTVKDASIISNSLTTTSLWGIDSHGIARIPHYLSRFEAGSLNIDPKFEFIQTGDATGQLDGDDGHGIVIVTEATEYALKMAKEAGVGVIGVKNSSHCGAIGLYTRRITAEGMVGIAFTHSDSLVTPAGGKKAFFGTNPISVAFPTENAEEPICLDMATSIIPWNYIMNARRDEKLVPVGYGVDNKGGDTQNANEIVAVKPMADYKGFALAFLIDMLCGPLNGMEFGPNIPAMYGELNEKRKLGSLVIAIDPKRFGGGENIRFMGTTIINRLKEQGDKILFPGQPEYLSKKNRLDNGIPISEGLASEFSNWSKKMLVPEPKYII